MMGKKPAAGYYAAVAGMSRCRTGVILRSVFLFRGRETRGECDLRECNANNCPRLCMRM